MYISRDTMAEKKQIKHKLVIDSKLKAIAPVCKEILSSLQANDYNEDDIFAVHLSLEEAFVNAVKHGNKCGCSGIKVNYSVGPDKVEISIDDGGEGFDLKAVPDPRCGDNIYKTDGRGLLLMQAYMDVVEYNKKGNCVHMVRYRNNSDETN